MSEKRVKISSIVENQLPNFIKEDFPLVAEFLSQYYTSTEYPGASADILQNLDHHIKLESLTGLTDSTTLSSDISFFETDILVESTSGFPDTYGLIQIDSEIITYTGKTETSFTGCVRGFSGITSFHDKNYSDHLVFNDSEISEHTSGTAVQNLSSLFLKEFFDKLKRQIVPGFENRILDSNLNQRVFIQRAKDFYSSKGTDGSFAILFGALYGEPVEVIKPRDYLFKPSDAQYRLVRDLVVEALDGDPELLVNRTLFQDQTTDFPKAFGSVTNVEKITRDRKEYYILSLDYDYDKDIDVSGSVFGKFSIHPQTKIVSEVVSGSDTIDVDSTVGFPEFGSLIVRLQNETELSISYQAKSLTQFFGCSGITQNIPDTTNIRIDAYAYGYVGFDTSTIAKVRVTGVLSNLQIDDQTKYCGDGDIIKIKSLGKEVDNIKFNNWFYNISTKYDVRNISLIDLSNNSYLIETYDENNFVLGDSIIIESNGNIVIGQISTIENLNAFVISGQGQLNLNSKYQVRKEISKTNSINYPEASIYSTNVQNVYYEENEDLYVASPSLPSYSGQPLEIKDRSITFSGSFSGETLVIGNHDFYTGDAVYYESISSTNSLGIPNGIYYIKRENNTSVKLSKSRANIYNESFVTVDSNGTIVDNKLSHLDFYNKTLKSQHLIRKISNPIETDIDTTTDFGPIGILVNGVEILNYKSKDSVFYGAIEKIDVISSGVGYDIITPPILSILDSQGSSAQGFCSVEGGLERIDVIDSGFDYVTDPIVNITGGSGTGAIAKAKLAEFRHSVNFNPEATALLVNLTNNTIGFSSFHKFRDGEKVTYLTNKGVSVGGLSTNSSYYVYVEDSLNVKLHKTYNDAIIGVNTISLTSYGSGNHSFVADNLKKKILKIDVINPGSGYKNKKINTSVSGINTYNNSIDIVNHGYDSGEIIRYSSSNIAPSGLVSNSDYYVTKISEDQFKLSPVGLGSTNIDFYYNTNQFVKLQSTGIGTHTFNYTPITVTIDGVIGVSTRSGQDFNAKVQPVFRGEIKSVFVSNGGSNYGSQEILNYNRQPTISANSGTGAEVIPVISDGKIVEVLVVSSGSGYNSPPDLIIEGSGQGALLTPIIQDGLIIEVKVITGGFGYVRGSVKIRVVSSGSGSNFQSFAKKWTINLVERYLQTNQITADDGFITKGINSDNELEYCHLYAPRKLRQSVYSSRLIGGVKKYFPDLSIINNVEVNSSYHSPIIGWAYDGNPIYGPYGYSFTTGGPIKQLKSGYELVNRIGRPATSTYPLGFFVEDYSFRSSGDLDSHNGRFCVTPEFPNGTYAYFASLDQGTESSLPFRGYKKPSFPYFVGNSFKSEKITENFDPKWNQRDIDINEKRWFRNTKPYGLSNKNSYYEYILNPNDIKQSNSIVRYSEKGSINSIGIKTSGINYKVGDTISFNNEGTYGTSAFAKVSSIKGKEINQISVQSTNIFNVEFVPLSSNNVFVGFATLPHSLVNSDIINISGLSTTNTGLSGNFVVGVRTDTLVLQSSVGSTSSTGIVTYFSVYGSLNYPYVRENDIFELDSEKVKVLNIDLNSSRIRVLREFDSTVGTSHTASTVLYSKSRKFTINSGISSSNYILNKEIYFDPKESLGIGTVSGVGIGSTIYFSNPGVGITAIFVPTKSIYLKDHNLQTGTEILYSSNGGTSIGVSTDRVTTTSLTENQSLYVAKITNDLIQIATSRVGLGSTGTFVGINSSVTTNTLYLTNVGAGDHHSFTTNYQNAVTGRISKNLVTVSTATTHGLRFNDSVNVTCISGVTTTYKISYNDNNRILTLNPKNFVGANVNINSNTISIQNHNYRTGDAVLHTSTSPSGGLLDSKIYYIIVVDLDSIRLSESYYNATILNPIYVDITSASLGTLSSVNPSINVIKNQNLVFDLSDDSLSYIKNSIRYSAFDFNLYYDPEFKHSFFTTDNIRTFNVIKSGRIGIDTTAKLTLTVNQNVPETLFYNLNPINQSDLPVEKLNLVTDADVINNNSIFIKDSVYSGKHIISGVGSTTFSYSVSTIPEKSNYLSTESTLSYATNSLSAFGGISEVRVTAGGRGYKSLPSINSINSSLGSEAVLTVNSENIGKIGNVEILDIGFDYPVDRSLRPFAQIPQILKVIPLNTFESIGVTSTGKNYSVAPDLIVLDGLTGNVIKDVDLRYNLNTNQVTILKNTKGINESLPTILPINNSNGVGINSVTFNSITKDVTVGLAVSFSDTISYPFIVGDKVLIENVSVGVGTTSKGYNSSAYNYSLFTLTSIDPNIGGSNGTITFNLNEYLGPNENPGVFDAVNSSGIVVPEKYFPIFNIKLTKNTFFKDEDIKSNTSLGQVENWDSNNELLRVSSSDSFFANDRVIGQSSFSEGIIDFVESYNSSYDVDSSSIVRKGWELETGFLNNSIQRLHDNDYYQYFSYSLKSKIEYEDWNNPVSSLNHTAGFKKFSDLVVESQDQQNVGINTNQNDGNFVGLADIITTIDTNCVYDFDLATERTLNISPIISKEIIFNTRVLQDYVESIGNRVLIIDDISNEFNSNPRSTQYSVVDIFRLDRARSRKIITYVRDRRFTDEKQILLLTLINDNSNAYISQYGRVETVADMGSFDYAISGDEGLLQFYPVDYTVNNFDISHVSYNMKDTISGIGTQDFGDTIQVKTSHVTLAPGTSTATTIVGIASTYRSSKLIVELSDNSDSYYEFNEFTVLHDGSNVELLEYGRITNDAGYGIGTFGASISGSNLILKFTPNVSLASTIIIDSVRISVASTQSTGVGTITLNTALLNSFYTGIGSTSSPVENAIASYSDPHSSAYYFVCVEDTTNNAYQVSEVVVATAGTISAITEFGEIVSDNTLGTIGVGVTNSTTELYFTPNPNINTQVRVFQNALRVLDDTNPLNEIDLVDASINSGGGTYTGTFTDIKRSFNLLHNGDQIFERFFNGSDGNIVEINENTIKVPNHFYVTGEELTYINPGAGTTQAIGISTVNTGIVGIGTTDRLPSTVYAVKVDNLRIKLASSAENALKTTPIVYDLTSVGISTTHALVAKNQNSRVIIGIDNVIQSPIVSTSVTTTVAEDVFTVDDVIKFAGTTSIFGGDLVQIGNEIVKINSVGFGSTNVLLVDRGWMGTGLTTHSSGTLVTKIYGDYNIVDNVINFISAPYGAIPLGTSTNPPDQRDYLGITTSSTFSGRSFIRSSTKNSSVEPYSKNYIYDDISSDFTGVTTEFTLKSSGSNIGGISTSNAIVLINEIFQHPQRLGGLIDIEGDYTLRESVGITSIQFTGSTTSTSSDINTSNVPVGGIIVSVGSTEGFGYQPLVSAGGTAIVSVAGTISSISIGNSGSGYRSGIQTVNVGVYTGGLGIVDIEYIGIATVVNGRVTGVAITNPGAGYTNTNAPLVYFDSPLSYANIPLVYSSSSVQGSGSNATVDIVVGQGSSVIDFEIKNLGYGYGQGEILTVSIGGTVGIPTNTSLAFDEFQIFVDRIQSDTFSAWTIGDLQVIDSPEDLFDGLLRSFPIKINGQQTSIRAKLGSLIDVEATLLVFLNDVLQVPGEGYTFTGGSYVNFTSPPKVGDKCNILFYKGTGDVDTTSVDILETVKIGDTVRLNDDNLIYKENSRVVTNVNSTDSVFTNPYAGPGISLNETYERPVIWCRQTEDTFVQGSYVAKDRVQYEPLIQPTTNIIQSVGIGSTEIFVESVKTFFDSNKENATSNIQSKIKIINQNLIVGASATAVVSSAGTISSIIISDGGVGYTTSPSVTISNPVGLGTTQRALVTASISGGTVSSITVSSPGTGYTNTKPPLVLIEVPTPITEEIKDVSYSGDFGTITGISTVSVGVASTGLVFDLFIPTNSYLRDSAIVGAAITVSGIQTGYYFVVNRSNVGNGVTSLYKNNTIVGNGTSFLDNVYEVAAVSIAQTAVPGVGITAVAKVTVSISNYNGLSGIGYSNFYGNYSWGKINSTSRTNPQSFGFYNNGLIGISTSPIVERVNPLKYLNYNS